MRNIALRLIAEEFDAGDAADNEARAAFRVCAKLGKSLSVLAGARGFGSLFARALRQAGEEAPWLNELAVSANGTFVISPEMEGKIEHREAAKAGATLVARLLELLATFIGAALTLRLMQQVYPKAALNPESMQP